MQKQLVIEMHYLNQTLGTVTRFHLNIDLLLVQDAVVPVNDILITPLTGERK